jgi:4'-phosphopantetheinyl transferase EntD
VVGTTGNILKPDAEISLDTLLPPTVRWAVMIPSEADPAALFPSERAQIADAVPVRRHEYAAVRELARRLFPEFGVDPCAILNGPDRAPRFPSELVGSFSHSRELALAVLASSSDLVAIGCDVEPRLPLPDNLSCEVLSARERAAIASQPRWFGRLLFSAKEAAYKAQYCLSGLFLDFDAVDVVLVPAKSEFTATLRVAAHPLRTGYRLMGRYQVTQSTIVTLVTIF